MGEKMSAYSEKLKSPKWQKKRLKILERDNWECQWCGEKETMLAVHHLAYQKGLDPWEYKDDKLLTLCDDCHGYEYKYRAEAEKQLLAALKERGYSCSDVESLGSYFLNFQLKYSADERIKMIELNTLFRDIERDYREDQDNKKPKKDEVN